MSDDELKIEALLVVNTEAGGQSAEGVVDEPGAGNELVLSWRRRRDKETDRECVRPGRSIRLLLRQVSANVADDKNLGSFVDVPVDP